MARQTTPGRRAGLSPFAAGLVALAVTGVATWFGFSGSNPFSDPFTLSAAFEDTGNVQPGAPVRIAGVDVGEVTKVETLPGGRKGARVEMEISDEGLPIHRDATLKVRSRIFLEGNTFIDLRPGSPSAGEIKDGDDPIPATQTATPVQLGEVLTTLQSDTREDLKTFLDEYSKGLKKGAAGFRESAKYWEDAYRDGALTSEAMLGEEPDRDVARLLRGGRRTAAALVRNEESLKGLVTNLAGTAGAFARESAALEASVPALRDLLEVAQPALESVNAALPSVREFAKAALPGVRTSEPVLRDGEPFLAQATALMAPRELRGTARILRRWMPSLVELNETTVGALEQARALSACTTKVLVPFAESPIPNPDEPENNNQQVYKQMQRGFVGLAGESRLTDGNQSWFRAMAVPPGELIPGIGGVRPAAPSDRGHQPPPRRPDVPCETQEPPNLNAPGGPLTQFISASERKHLRSLPVTEDWKSAIEVLPKLLRSWDLGLRKRAAAEEARSTAAEAAAGEQAAADRKAADEERATADEERATAEEARAGEQEEER